jgi:hypothetical protein
VLAVISTAKGSFNEGFGLKGGHTEIKRTRWTEPRWGVIHLAIASGMFKNLITIYGKMCFFYCTSILRLLTSDASEYLKPEQIS